VSEFAPHLRLFEVEFAIPLTLFEVGFAIPLMPFAAVFETPRMRFSLVAFEKPRKEFVSPVSTPPPLKPV
jgi:hypothetical protein